MHPNLAPHLHGEECRKIINLLNQCHADNPYRKFLGACNDFKRALNRCLQKEYEVKQKQNYQDSIGRKKNYQKFMRELDSDD